MRVLKVICEASTFSLDKLFLFFRLFWEASESKMLLPFPEKICRVKEILINLLVVYKSGVKIKNKF